MSQDLFAAFGASESKPDPSVTHQVRQQAQGHLFEHDDVHGATASHSAEHSTFDDDDDFGDFEDASQPSVMPNSETITPARAPGSAMQTSKLPFKTNSKPQSTEPTDPRIGRHPFAAHMELLFSADDDEYNAGEDDLEDLSRNPEAAMAYSKRLIHEQLSKQANHRPQSPATTTRIPDLREASKPPETASSLQRTHDIVRRKKDPNVLFDAEDVSDESGEDDFGDFEDAPDSNAVPAKASTRPANDQSAMPDIDLLGLNDPVASPHRPASSSASELRRPLPVGGSKSPRDPHPVPLRPQPVSFTDDDAWDDFDEVDTTSQPPQARSANVTKQEARSGGRGQDRSGNTDASSPPTNVPPPVMLLSLFPSIFAHTQEVLLDPLSKLDVAARQELLTHSASLEYLRMHLIYATALGHIIAGRKSRWKRDQHLAQSMRIGPAAAGGKGGMKLAGVDKSEVAKEDREALDAVRLWKRQVGKLRGAVATAAASKSAETRAFPAVPEISDQMPVKTLKAVEGGFTAPHACALCGLKREERVAKIDVDINDSFGEWWLDNMSMHLVCRDFWVAHRDKLKSR